jgi:AcrR family transcriptional regulator
MSATTGQDRRGARERLLDTASRLFYAEGVHTVGIDRILAESGVAKASLYKTFGSKDALIQAYLAGRGDRIRARLAEAVARVDDPRAKILAVYDAQFEIFAEPGFRGCAFVAASAEAMSGDPVDEATAVFRGAIRSMFVDLARGVGAPDPESLGRALHLLYEGASLSARLDHDPTVAADARAAADALVTAAVAR